MISVIIFIMNRCTRSKICKAASRRRARDGHRNWRGARDRRPRRGDQRQRSCLECRRGCLRLRPWRAVHDHHQHGHTRQFASRVFAQQAGESERQKNTVRVWLWEFLLAANVVQFCELFWKMFQLLLVCCKLVNFKRDQAIGCRTCQA